MRASQWYRTNYGTIVISIIGVMLFMFFCKACAHVDLIDPGMITENAIKEAEQRERRQEAKDRKDAKEREDRKVQEQWRRDCELAEKRMKKIRDEIARLEDE
jgi:hypothetical protein